MNWTKNLPRKGTPKQRRSMMLNVDYSTSPEILDWIISESEKHLVTKSEIVRAIMYEAYKQSLDSQQKSGEANE